MCLVSTVCDITGLSLGNGCHCMAISFSISFRLVFCAHRPFGLSGAFDANLPCHGNITLASEPQIEPKAPAPASLAHPTTIITPPVRAQIHKFLSEFQHKNGIYSTFRSVELHFSQDNIIYSLIFNSFIVLYCKYPHIHTCIQRHRQKIVLYPEYYDGK